MARFTRKHVFVAAAALLVAVGLMVWIVDADEATDGGPSPAVPGTVPAAPVTPPPPIRPPQESVGRPASTTSPWPEPVARTIAAPATLVVRVVDAAARRPIAGARVSLFDSEEDERTGPTGAEGSVRVDGLPPGVTEIRLAADGFLPADRTLVLAANATETIDIALEAAVALEGVVLDATSGAALAKADVEVFARDVAGERPLDATVSDASGRFRFAVLPPGIPVRARAWRPGYVLAAATAELRAAGAGAAHVELRLAQCGVVRGVVRRPDGRGAAGATVRVVPTDAEAAPWDGAFAETAADGSYAIRTAPVGVDLTVAATARGWAPAAPASIRVPADGRDAVQNLALRRPATLVVILFGTSADCPCGAKVWVDDVKESAGWSAVCDSKHKRETTVHEGLAPGPHTVHVEPHDYAATTREIALAEGERATVEIRLEDGVSIEGSVVDDAGRPVPGAAVFALHADFAHPRRRMSSAARSGIAGPGGSFRIDGVGPGSYDLYVLGAREAGLVSPEIDPVRTAVDAPSRDVRLVVPRETRIVLRVLLPAGVPRPREVLVTQESDDGLSPNRIGDRRRALAIDAAAWSSEGIIRCSFPAGGTWLRIGVTGLAPELVRVPQWELGRLVDLGAIQLDAGLELRGRVVDSDGHPLAGATVTTSADASVEVRTKEDGTFVVAHLATGSVLVRAVADGCYGGKYVGEVIGAAPIVVRARRLGRLTGVVVDPRGTPVAGAHVVFDRSLAHETLSNGWIETFVLAELDDAVTGEDGRFSLAVPCGLCAGRVGTVEFESYVPGGGESNVRVVIR